MLTYHEHILTLRGDMRRYFNVTLPDVIKQFFLITVSKHEWRLTSEHFIYNASYTPPVDSETVSLSIDNLWSEVLRCATQRHCIVISLDVFF
jgi:hypothetical protein